MNACKVDALDACAVLARLEKNVDRTFGACLEYEKEFECASCSGGNRRSGLTVAQHEGYNRRRERTQNRLHLEYEKAKADLGNATAKIKAGVLPRYFATVHEFLRAEVAS